jgi:hypothetical protein
MTNQHRKSKKQTARNGNPRALAAKKTQVIDAAREQKKKAAVRTVHGGGPNVAVGNDAGGPSRSCRRSSRLNGIGAMTEYPAQSRHTKDANAAVASRKRLPLSHTPSDEGGQLDAQGGLEEVQDLRRQLQEERRQSSHTL